MKLSSLFLFFFALSSHSGVWCMCSLHAIQPIYLFSHHFYSSLFGLRDFIYSFTNDESIAYKTHTTHNVFKIQDNFSRLQRLLLCRFVLYMMKNCEEEKKRNQNKNTLKVLKANAGKKDKIMQKRTMLMCASNSLRKLFMITTFEMEN